VCLKQVIFYIASDVPWVVSTLSAAFPNGHVVTYGGTLCGEEYLGRSAECLQRALVEQLILAHNKAVQFCL
jgi:hypothetical protein